LRYALNLYVRYKVIQSLRV